MNYRFYTWTDSRGHVYGLAESEIVCFASPSVTTRLNGKWEEVQGYWFCIPETEKANGDSEVVQ